MGFDRFVHRTKYGVDAGHQPDCQFTDNFGPSCHCDGKPLRSYRELTLWLEHLGWKADERRSHEEWPSYYRHIGQHVIRVSRVHAGWHYTWIRMSGMTIHESQCFGTVTAALNDLWELVVSRADHHFATELELIAFKSRTGVQNAKDLP